MPQDSPISINKNFSNRRSALKVPTVTVMEERKDEKTISEMASTTMLNKRSLQLVGCTSRLPGVICVSAQCLMECALDEAPSKSNSYLCEVA